MVGRTCYEVSHHFSVPCDQAGEICLLARSRETGQRERVLHLHHTSQGESYVDIELVPLRDACGEQAYFIEKMEPLRVAQAQLKAHRGSRTELARKLGISERSLYRKLRDIDQGSRT